MTPIIDNWVLIVDGNNYTIARFFGEKTDKNGKTYKDIREGYLAEKADLRRAKQREYRQKRKAAKA